MAMAPVSQHELLIRDIVVQDSVALQKWGRVVDRIVSSPTDVLRIKGKLTSQREGSFEEAVLQSLRLFYSRGGTRSGLTDLLRSESIGLNALAERIQELPTTSSAGLTTPTIVSLWGEVGSIVENFTGRAVEVEKTHKKLGDVHKRSRETGAVSIVSISGLGGIGKSTLARKYAFTYRDFYDGNVAWINAETIESMRASFITLVKRIGLQLGDQPPQEFLVEKVFGYFQSKKFLFIYDNVENLGDFKQFLPKVVDPGHKVPYILVTTRRADLNSLPANEIHLDVLTTEEAVELIQKMLPHSRMENAVKLADKLQRLPLALQQALAYIRDTSVGDHDESIVEYLKEFDKSEAELLKDERFRDHDDYSSTTFATWQITLARIKEMKDGESAIKVINALAYLNPDLISMKILKLIFEEETRRGLKLLERFSMIHVNERKRVVIHRLVQHIVRLSFNGQEEEQLQILVTAIEDEFNRSKLNDLSRECMSHGLHLFSFQMKRRHSETITSSCGYFVVLSRYLNVYGNYTDSLSISQQMASFYESVHGDKHESTIMMKLRIATAYNFLDKPMDSVQILNAILPDAKLVLGTENEMTMNIQSTLAACLSETGDSLKAAQMYKELIPVAERVFGKDDHKVLAYKLCKAVALRRLEKFKESFELLYHVNEKYVSMYGEADATTLLIKSQIAYVLYEKKEFAKALEIWEEVEAGYKPVFGDAHPETITVQNNIAMCKANLSQQKNRASQQMPSFHESLPAEKHGSIIRMKWRVADAYYFLGKFADSVQILNAILPDAKLVLGTEHWLTMEIQSRLADCLIECGDSRNVLKMYKDIIGKRKRSPLHSIVCDFCKQQNPYLYLLE